MPFSHLLSVNDEVVDRAPLKQALDFLSVGGLIPTCSQSDHSRVICKLNNRVRWKGGETVRGVQSKGEGVVAPCTSHQLIAGPN